MILMARLLRNVCFENRLAELYALSAALITRSANQDPAPLTHKKPNRSDSASRPKPQNIQRKYPFAAKQATETV